MSRLYLLARAINVAATPLLGPQTRSSLRRGISLNRIHNIQNPQQSLQSRGFRSAAIVSAEKVKITFVETDGTKKQVEAEIGQSILDAAHEHDIDLEGACEGTLACSTCHVIVDDDAYFQKLPPPEEEELDMLDLAIGLEDNSRLGCQIVIDKDLEGIVLRLPADTLDRRGRAE